MPPAREPAALPRLDRAALRDRLRGFMEIRRHRWKNASLADAGSMVCYAALKALLRRLLPGEAQDALHNTLLKALPGLASSRPAIELWKLSRLIRADAELAALFATAEPDAVVAGGAHQAGLCAVRPRLRHLPERLGLPLLRGADADGSELPGESRPRSSRSSSPTPSATASRPKDVAGARQQAERVAETARVLADGRPDPRRSRCACCSAGRSGRFSCASGRGSNRRSSTAGSAASRWRSATTSAPSGRLERRDDVFMLTFDELDTLLAGGAMFPDHLAEEIRGRLAAHAELCAMRPPDKFVLAEGAYLESTERRGTVPFRPRRRQKLTSETGEARRPDRHERVRRTGDGPRDGAGRRDRSAQAPRRRHPRHAPDRSGMGARLSVDRRPRDGTRRHAVARRDHRARVRHPVDRRRGRRHAADSNRRDGLPRRRSRIGACRVMEERGASANAGCWSPTRASG